LPPLAAYMAVSPENVVVSVIKKAEDNEDLIVRGYETHGRPAQATIRLLAWERTIEASFTPCEIKTFRVPKNPARPIVETSLIEW